MTNSKGDEKKNKRATDEVDVWDRFERAVDIALHTRPVHKESPKKATAKPKAKKPKASRTS
tara:strand:- start:1505 stop:1687 length:183 start_codon:yes stop_codon:yes gene_type:complete